MRRLATLCLPLALVAGLGLALQAVSTLPALPAPAASGAAGPVPAARPDGPAAAPYDPAPPMTIPTTAGDLRLGGPSDTSTVFIGLNRVSSGSEAIWNGAVDQLLATSPEDVRYVFMSYAATSEALEADLGALRARVDAAIAKLPEASAREHWAASIYYIPVNPLTLEGAFPEILRDWGATGVQLSAAGEGPEGPATVSAFGTTDTAWAAPWTGPVTLPLSAYGNLACGQDAPTAAITGTATLAQRGTCTFSEKAANAEKHGAEAIIIYTTPDRPKLWMGASCGSSCPQVHVTMVDADAGEALEGLVASGKPVTVTLNPFKLGADNLAVDHRGRLRELGTIPFPFSFQGLTNPDPLRLVAYEAVQYRYERLLDERLAAEDAAGKTLTVPVFEGVWASDPGWTGQQVLADVTLPDAAAMARFDKLEVELAYACEGNRKGRCPAWDYLVYLYLCDDTAQARCTTEFGRWITPYWSGGRWVTDLSPMLAFLADGGPKRFGFWTVQKYRLDMTFRFTDTGARLAPKRLVPILSGGAFWKDYNKNRHPIAFQVPDWAEELRIASFLTGHGENDTRSCGEFCPHTHHITVNGRPEHVFENAEAGTDYGCMNRVAEGVVPNQAGTWIFGRAGWCPGQDVKPWVLDISADVVRGEWNELSYKGLLDGKDYVAQPVQGAGEPNARIDLTGYLVYYAPKDASVGEVAPPYPRIPSTLLLPLAYTGRP